jgi:lysozyme
MMGDTDWLQYYDALVRPEEGCKLQAYPDPITHGAPWTCGWGTTGSDIGPNTAWTQAYADQRFDATATAVGDVVDQHVTVPLTPQMKAAVASILENVGAGSATRDGIIRLKTGQPSTLLRKLNAGDYQGACDEFPKWDSPGSNVQHGLDIRRHAECALFISGGTPDV